MEASDTVQLVRRGTGRRAARRGDPAAIRARVAAVAVLALALFCSFPAAAGDRPVVILLSWDGTRHDYPDRVPAPALARMAREGTRADHLVPVFPSSTFPNHVSLATGTYPDRHGIIENAFTDRDGRRFDHGSESGWLEAEPLWVAAERQGLHAAVLFWVGSESDWRGRGPTYRVVPFDERLADDVKADRILAWLDLPDDARPSLVMSWWHGCDGAGHADGPNSPAISQALLADDRALARLFAGIDARGAWADTTVIVTSDHGMAEISRVVDPQAALDAAGIRARTEYVGGEAQVYLGEPARADAALRALAHAGIEAYANAHLPERLRSNYPGRSGDLTLLAHPPAMFARVGWRERAGALLARLRGKVRGAHGYDPALPDMGAIFYALGRGIPHGEHLGEVHAIDVAPTIAALLGIAPPEQSEGQALFK